MLKVAGRRVVVVGGGPVGLRKVRSLCEAGADVLLVAERGDGEANLGASVTVIREPYRPEHLRGAMLVFACTDDRPTNARIAADARACGALVNAADQQEDCDFFAPAVVADGDVILAAGTGGTAPALTAALKARLAEALPQRVGQFADVLGNLREDLRGRVADRTQRRRIMRQLASEETYRAFLAGGPDAVRKRLEELTGT